MFQIKHTPDFSFMMWVKISFKSVMKITKFLLSNRAHRASKNGRVLRWDKARETAWCCHDLVIHVAKRLMETRAVRLGFKNRGK
jgi:hypothetical protein